MVLKTRDFGSIDITEDDIIYFKMPIFGFDEYRRFAFLYDEEISEHFVWLQSADEPGLCFTLVSTDFIAGGYNPNIPDNINNALGEGDLTCWLIMVVKDDFAKSTVNLKSPIVVNPNTKLGAQVILDEDYPIQHLLITHLAREED